MRKLNTAICALTYLTLLVTRGWGASNTPCPQMPALKHRLSFSTSAPEMQGKKKAFSSGGRGWRGRFELSTTKWGWKTFSDTGGLKRERERERIKTQSKEVKASVSYKAICHCIRDGHRWQDQTLGTAWHGNSLSQHQADIRRVPASSLPSQESGSTVWVKRAETSIAKGLWQGGETCNRINDL